VNRDEALYIPSRDGEQQRDMEGFTAGTQHHNRTMAG